MGNSLPYKRVFFNGIEKEPAGWYPGRVFKHAAYWLFWWLLFATMNSSNSSAGFGKWGSIEFVIMLIKLPYTYFMIYFLVPRYLIRRDYSYFAVGVLLSTLTGGSIVWSFYFHCLSELVEYARSGHFICAGFFYKTIDLVYVSTFPVIYKLYQSFLRQERKNREMDEQKMQAELEMLKHQLQPHFLFNTLNNLYGMILMNDRNSAGAILRLSNIMSYMLHECNATFIPLEKEIDHLKDYIELEKIRYGRRISVSFEVGGAIRSEKIAPLLLIGFVENAFKHGAGRSRENAWIRLNCWAEDRTLYFLIENSFANNELVKTATIPIVGGIGLKNIKKRLELIYPGNYQLKIESNETFQVYLQLGLQTSKSQ